MGVKLLLFQQCIVECLSVEPPKRERQPGRQLMRLKEDQIVKIAEKILGDLSTAELIELKQDRLAALNAIKSAITDDIRGEEALEKDAARILDQTLRGMGNTATEIDQNKMLRMIKEKLAKERKIVL